MCNIASPKLRKSAKGNNLKNIAITFFCQLVLKMPNFYRISNMTLDNL